MAYELTRYGEEYLETAPQKLDELWERLPKEASKEGLTRIKRSTSFVRLNKRTHILSKIRSGEDPIESSFEFLPAGPKRTRARNALKKELDSMLRANLIEESSGREQEIQVDRVTYRPGLSTSW